MLDLKLWSKLYWENEKNHWNNLAKELKNEDPYDLAIEVAKRIQKINDDYFQECAEGSPGYHPSVELDKKFKKLKKELGEKARQISIKNWINQLNQVGEKGIIFFYYFERQTELKETKEIIPQLNNYNEIIIDYLKTSLLEQNSTMKEQVLEKELKKILEIETQENHQFVLDFYLKERKENWFKEKLNEIVSFKTFLYFNLHLIEETNEDLIQWSKFLNKNVEKDNLTLFNGNMLSYLDCYEKEQRAFEFLNQLPVNYLQSFKSLLFSDLNTMEQLNQWYSLVIREDKNEKGFFDLIWLHQDEGLKLTTKLSPESLILDFIANKMSVIYPKEELDKYDFTQSMIINDNIQELMNRKLSYYYLENKLTPNNKKSKSLKI